MSRTPDQVQAELLQLLPDGFAWPGGDPDTYMAARLRPIANEWSLVEQSMESLQGELDPGTAQYLLPDYLGVLGPDPYGRDELTLSSAQVSLLAHQRWVDAPIICAGYFIRSAADLGITITIEEFPLPVCGEAVCGDVLLPWLQQCVFLVTLPSDDIWDAICGDTVCGDTLGGFTPSVLENFIMDKTPLFARAVFSYT
jgi:uncharacterized protein YmfQ (DUF2313 family)